MEYFVGLLILLMSCLLIYGFAIEKEEKHKRLVSILEGAIEPETSKTSWINRVEGMLAKVLPSQLGNAMMEKNLRQAGRPFGWSARDVTLVRVVAAVVLVGISLLSGASVSGQIMTSLIFSLVGFMIPNLLIFSYKSMRQGKIRKQIRAFQVMLALLSGTAIRFDQALHEAIQSTTGEFRKLLEEMERRMDFNSTIPEGFAWLSDEIGLPEITRLSVVIEQSIQNNSPLGSALQMMIEEYDDQLENKVERLSQNVNIKVTLTVLFLILGPSILFDGLIAGINFVSSLNGF